MADAAPTQLLSWKEKSSYKCGRYAGLQAAAAVHVMSRSLPCAHRQLSGLAAISLQRWLYAIGKQRADELGHGVMATRWGMWDLDRAGRVHAVQLPRRKNDWFRRRTIALQVGLVLEVRSPRFELLRHASALGLKVCAPRTRNERDERRTFRANEFMSHPVATPTVKDTSTIETRALFPRSVAMAEM